MGIIRIHLKVYGKCSVLAWHIKHGRQIIARLKKSGKLENQTDILPLVFKL